MGILSGTGHPAPGTPEQRPGENRWTSGLFARDVETGALRWFDGINPHDLYGLGATAPNLMIDRDWNGAPRHLLIHPDANGYLYVLDRTTGAILSARPFAPVNATTGVDNNGDGANNDRPVVNGVVLSKSAFRRNPPLARMNASILSAISPL